MVWDKTLPPGTEAKSNGDNRIRELKTDIEAALGIEGTFPGGDTSNPIYVNTPSAGNTASRPVTSLVTGRLYINTQTFKIERYNGASWDAVDLVPADDIDGSKIADNAIDSEHYTDGSIDRVHLAADIVDGTKIADDSVDSEHLAAGGIDLEHMSANSIDSDQYVNGSIDLAHMSANSVDSDQYVDGSIDFAHLAILPGFLAYNSAQDADVTGDGTDATIDFDTEVYDTGSDFSGDVFTAPITGKYLLIAQVTDNALVASGHVSRRISIVTSNRNYDKAEQVLTTSETSHAPLTIMVIADMDANDTASVNFDVTGGTKTVDINSAGWNSGISTFFSGKLLI